MLDNVVDLRGTELKIHSKRWHSNLSEYNPPLSVHSRCNTNVVFLTSHVIGRKICAYLCYYSSKLDLKKKDFILYASQARREILEEFPNDSPSEKARRMLIRTLTCLNNYSKLTLAEAVTAGLGRSMWYCSHPTVSYYWPEAVNHANRTIEKCDHSLGEVPKMRTDGKEMMNNFIMRNDANQMKVFRNDSMDYESRSRTELQNLSTYRFMRCLGRVSANEQNKDFLWKTRMLRANYEKIFNKKTIDTQSLGEKGTDDELSVAEDSDENSLFFLRSANPEEISFHRSEDGKTFLQANRPDTDPYTEINSDNFSPVLGLGFRV